MPLHVYRLMPALAVALGARYLPGEWLLHLRARSEAHSLELRLTVEQALALRQEIASAGRAFSGGRFPLARVAPCPAEHPLLAAPFDLEAEAGDLRLIRPAARRLLGIEARGTVDGSPYLAEVVGTPEQLLALAEQIEAVCRAVSSVCPVCGRPVAEGDHVACQGAPAPRQEP